GVAEAVDGARLATETPHQIGIGGQRPAQNLERFAARQVDVLDQIDLAHRPLAEALNDAISLVHDGADHASPPENRDSASHGPATAANLQAAFGLTGSSSSRARIAVGWL